VGWNGKTHTNTLVNKLHDHLVHKDHTPNSLKAGQILNKPMQCDLWMGHKEYFSPQISVTFQRPYSIIFKGVSSISLHHCTVMMNFCKLWLKQDMQVVLRVRMCSSLSHIQKACFTGLKSGNLQCEFFIRLLQHILRAVLRGVHHLGIEDDHSPYITAEVNIVGEVPHTSSWQSD